MITLIIKADSCDAARALALAHGIKLELAARHARFRSEIWASAICDRSKIVRWMCEAESALLFYS